MKPGDFFPKESKKQPTINMESFNQTRPIKHVNEVINILSGFLFGRRS